MLTYRGYVACCLRGPILHAQAGQHASMPASARYGRNFQDRPRSAVRMARRCPDAPNALVVPGDRSTTKRGVMRDGFRLFPRKIHRFFC